MADTLKAPKPPSTGKKDTTQGDFKYKMKSMGGAWFKERKDKSDYQVGYCTSEQDFSTLKEAIALAEEEGVSLKFMIFVNEKKQKKSSPDYIMYVAPATEGSDD